MRLPIQYALTYPDRIHLNEDRLDLFKQPLVPGEVPIPVDQTGYFDHTTATAGTEARSDVTRLWWQC